MQVRTAGRAGSGVGAHGIRFQFIPNHSDPQNCRPIFMATLCLPALIQHPSLTPWGPVPMRWLSIWGKS